MNWVDAIIALLVVSAAFNGRSSGALRQIGGLVGLVGGFVIGTWVAPQLSVHVTSSSWRPLAAIGILIVCSSLGGSLGSFLGGVANKGLKLVALGSLDAAGGAVIGAMTSLITCWFLASVLVNLSWFSVGAAVNSSAIVTTMDKVMPPVAQLEGKVLNLIREADFPQVFASVTAPPATPYPAPLQSVANAAAGSGTASVVKVLALGACGADHEGTGFVVGRGAVLTNAHVIAGATQIQIGTHLGTLVSLDTRNDLALIRVATDGRTPLSFQVSVNPATASAVVGYPLDGGLTVTPSVVGGHLTATSRDIYNKVSFTRSMLVIAGVVQPGNSGSPVFVSGRVVGVIFSKSLSQRATAYAVPADVATAFVRASTGTAAVSTGACPR